MKSRLLCMVWACVGVALLAVAAGAETVSGVATSGGRVYSYLADGSRPSRAVLMWAKKGTDVDLAVFADDSPDPIPVAIGIGSEDRLEVVEHGAVAGALYFVVVQKFSGPNSKFYANVSTQGSEGLSRRAGLRSVGSLAALAARDPYFERMRELMDAARSHKSRRPTPAE